MKITPLAERVLLRPLKEEQKAAGGLVIPVSNNQEKPEQGEVLGVGAKVELDIKKGDLVLFSKYAPQEIKVGDKEYLLLDQKSVLAKIEK